LDRQVMDITAAQMCLRAMVVFVLAIAMLRLGSARFVGRSTSLDILVAIIFGSVVSRGITGNSPFVPTLAAALTLIVLHSVTTAFAARSHAFGKVVKGQKTRLVRDGQIDWEAMAAAHISEHDLHEALRANGAEPDVARVKSAHLERNGDITVVLAEAERG
jgi:uncharacterized membrane protein YcaP (DUF421 family)